ncbi:MAG: hypothetical protein E7K95_12045, partial [Staphylococcus epidermidis]|nr:hypothetical protein [Staphylococcus epidermidis]
MILWFAGLFLSIYEKRSPFLINILYCPFSNLSTQRAGILIVASLSNAVSMVTTKSFSVSCGFFQITF